MLVEEKCSLRKIGFGFTYWGVKEMGARLENLGGFALFWEVKP